MKTFCIALITFVLSAPILSADQIDHYVEARLKRENVPGASIAVVRDGKVIKARGYGLADVENDVPATEHTVYQWASVTKQFTAAAVLLLSEEGKLRLDERVSRYYTNAPGAWSNVTVRELLTHTSGIKSYTSLNGFFRTVRKDYAPEELLDLVRGEPLEFAPGEKWSYNNTGYFLLGLIIEKMSGQSYGEFLEERIFGPLDMKTARVNHQFEIIPNRATGYLNASNKILRSEFVSPSQPYAAGALMGTVLDLAKWDAALYTDKLFSGSIREEMWKPVKLNGGEAQPYGFGWAVSELRGHPYVAHGGGIHGFSTYITRFFKDKLTVIVLMNAGADPGSVAHGIAGHYLTGLTLSSIKPPKRDPDPELTQRLKQSLADLAEKKESYLITAEFRQDYAKSKSRAESLKKRLAGLKSFTFVTAEEPAKTGRERFGVPVARVCAYKLVTPEETRFYTFELTGGQESGVVSVVGGVGSGHLDHCADDECRDEQNLNCGDNQSGVAQWAIRGARAGEERITKGEGRRRSNDARTEHLKRVASAQGEQQADACDWDEREAKRGHAGHGQAASKDASSRASGDQRQ